MSVPFEKLVKEDLNRGFGTVEVSMPAGGVATGNKVGLHTFHDYRFNVMDFGAVGDGVADDTVAIQAAIDAAKTTGQGVQLGTLTPAATVIFPMSRYRISSLDCTFNAGLELLGTSPWGVHLYADLQTDSAKPAIDLTGCIGGRFRGITVHGTTIGGLEPTIPPSCGWLIAETSATGDSTAHYFESCGSSGYFASAGLYIYGGVDHTFVDCGFSTSALSANAIFCGGVNSYSVTSPYQAIATGTRTTGDNTFYSCEIHGANSASYAAQPIFLHTVFAVRFIACLCDSSGLYQVRFDGTDEDILFSGTQFYSENGHPSEYLFFANSATVRLVAEGCYLTNAYSTSMVGGSSGSYAGSRLIGFTSSLLTGDHLYYCADQDIHCGAIDAGLTGGNTVYLGPHGASGTEAFARVPCHRPGVFVGMRVDVSSDPGSGKTYAFTLRKNGSDTAITATISDTATTASDLTNVVTVAAGDVIDVKAVASATADTLAGVGVVVGFIPAG